MPAERLHPHHGADDIAVHINITGLDTAGDGGDRLLIRLWMPKVRP